MAKREKMVPEVSISPTPCNPFLQTWFAPLLEHGATFCASNLDTSISFLRAGDIELPLTCNEAEWGNSWICSPYTHYVSYAREEIERAAGPATQSIVGAALSGIGAWLKRVEFNRVVMVNNWLLSTNPWPKWDGENLPEVFRVLTTQWPDHALVFRSLNEKESAPLLDRLRRAGARIVPSRQVWWYEPDSTAVSRSRDFRKDRNLLQQDDLVVVPHEELRASDFPAIKTLYDSLYLKKYSPYNPQFSVSLLQHWHQENLAKFTALRTKGGTFVGVEACVALHGVLTSPVVGYDLTAPLSLGLYRRLAAIAVLEGRRTGTPLNLSAGVGRFKALRGGEATMEFIAVYDSHLPLRRRLPWKVIEQGSVRVLAPYVQSRQL